MALIKCSECGKQLSDKEKNAHIVEQTIKYQITKKVIKKFYLL